MITNASFRPTSVANVFAIVDPVINDNLRHRTYHGPFKASIRRLIKQPDAVIHLRQGVKSKSSRHYFRITLK